MLSTSAGSKNTKNTGSSTDIEYDFILKVLGVVLNSSSVGAGSGSILEHLLVDVEVRVRAVVVVMLLLVEVSEHAGLVSLLIEPSTSVSSEAFLSSVLNFILKPLLSLLISTLVLVLAFNLILLVRGLLVLVTSLLLVVISIGLGSLRSGLLILRLFLIIIVATGGLSLAVTLSGTRSLRVISSLRHFVVVLADVALSSHLHVLRFSDLTFLFHFLL
jgi:hypothetical protein